MINDNYTFSGTIVGKSSRSVRATVAIDLDV